MADALTDDLGLLRTFRARVDELVKDMRDAKSEANHPMTAKALEECAQAFDDWHSDTLGAVATVLDEEMCRRGGYRRHRYTGRRIPA